MNKNLPTTRDANTVEYMGNIWGACIVYIKSSTTNNNYKRALKTRLFENKNQVVANTRVLGVHF